MYSLVVSCVCLIASDSNGTQLPKYRRDFSNESPPCQPKLLNIGFVRKAIEVLKIETQTMIDAARRGRILNVDLT